MGKAEFVRSLDPKSSKEQTWNERELGQKWKKNNWSEAWQIERAAEAARPKQECPIASRLRTLRLIRSA